MYRTASYPARDLLFVGFRIADVSSECGNGIVEFSEVCDDGNNTDGGPGDYCSADCSMVIPAVSQWGLLVITLLGLTAGTLVFAKRKRQLA